MQNRFQIRRFFFSFHYPFIRANIELSGKFVLPKDPESMYVYTYTRVDNSKRIATLAKLLTM